MAAAAMLDSRKSQSLGHVLTDFDDILNIHLNMLLPKANLKALHEIQYGHCHHLKKQQILLVK